MSEETNLQTEVERAWDGSYSFLGKPLAEWNHRRERAAIRMGFIGPAGLRLPDGSALIGMRDYPAQVDDVAIFFWLLTLKKKDDMTDEDRSKPGAWYIELANSAPEIAREIAFNYAYDFQFSTNDLRHEIPDDPTTPIKNPNAKNWLEAKTVFWAVMEGIEASKFEIENDSRDDGEDSGEKKV